MVDLARGMPSCLTLLAPFSWRRFGLSSRSIMRYFAQQLDTTLPAGLPRRVTVDGEDEDCIVM